MRLFLRILSGWQPADHGVNQTVGASIQCQWLVRDDRGQTLAQGETNAAGLGDMANLSGSPFGEPFGKPDALIDPDVVVLVPSAQVAWLSRTVPGRRAAQIQRALPFAVEEDLTQDVESMHLAHGPIVRGQPVRCALVDRRLLADWLDCLRDCGLRPDHMVPDACLLPCSQSSASVLFEDGEAFVRTPDHIATIEASTLPEILESVRASFDDANASPELELIGGEAIDERMDGSGFDVRRTPLSGSVLRIPRIAVGRPSTRDQPAAGPVCAFQRRARFPRQVARRRRSGRTLADRGAGRADWRRLRCEPSRGCARSRIDRPVSEHLPWMSVVFPMPTRRCARSFANRMQGRLHSTRCWGNSLPERPREVPNVSVRSITFNDSRGELTSELWLPGYARLDALKLELERRGLVVDISSAEERDNVVRARLRIRMPA